MGTAASLGNRAVGAQSRLQLEAQTPLSTLGLNRRVLVQSGEGFVGTWQEMPPAGSSLGYGVFLKDVAIEPFDSQFAMVTDLFQAFAGDANGDEHFDSADLVSIFQAGHFEQAGEAPIDCRKAIGMETDSSPRRISWWHSRKDAMSRKVADLPRSCSPHLRTMQMTNPGSIESLQPMPLRNTYRFRRG